MAVRGLGKVSAVLLDLSGTLHVESTPTPSAVAALTRLRGSGLPLRFITNTTKESRKQLFLRLHSMGFHIREEEVFTTLTATRRLLEREELRPMFLLEDSAKEDFEGVDCSQPNCVVVGLAPSKSDYDHLNKAFRLLMNGGRLVATHKSRYFERKDGLAIGPGAFVAALEYASGREAIVVGKPEPAFYQSVMKELNLPPNEMVMIGDDVVNDVHGAQLLGMKGILVKTGKYREGNESSIDPPPSAICENFSSAVDLILSNLGSLDRT